MVKFIDNIINLQISNVQILFSIVSQAYSIRINLELCFCNRGQNHCPLMQNRFPTIQEKGQLIGAVFVWEQAQNNTNVSDASLLP